MTTETWQAVPGYEGAYEISDMGRVRSVDRMSAQGHLRGRLRRLGTSVTGYVHVGLCRDGKLRNVNLARMVATVFIRAPKDDEQVNHLDGVKANNAASNLEWCTRSMNNLHRCRVLGKNRGMRHGNAKLTDADIHDIRREVAAGRTTTSVGRARGLNHTTVARIARRKSWQHVPEQTAKGQ